MMFKPFASLPIFRRLFLAFFLAVLIPDSIIVLNSTIYTRALIAHGTKISETSPLIFGTILALLVSTGFVMLLGYLVNGTITQPLQQLAALAKRIRQGETSARASITGRDEIAIVASSINSMLDQIQQFITQTQHQRDHLQQQIEQLIEQVAGVSEGDLRIQATVSDESIGVLAEFFNSMVEELSHLVIQVKGNASEIETATTSATHEMLYLETTAETQLQQISRTTSIVEQMAQSCLHVREQTQTLDSAARNASQVASQGRQRMQQTLEGFSSIHHTAQQTTRNMQDLGVRSQHIEEIVKILENIATHITRLSLDAAIQAAMAGDTKNSGFGEVAKGIRRLSDQTKEQLVTVARSVKDVRTNITLVATSIQESERETAVGVTRIQETRQSLSTIFTLVEQQAREIATINRMMQDLFSAAREIAETMNTISQVTTQSRDRTRMVSSKMRQLTQFEQHLVTSVEVFKVKDEPVSTQQRKQYSSVK